MCFKPILFLCSISVWYMTAVGNQRWMQQSCFGLMFHYEAFVDHSPESYNRTIESFDVKEFVQAVESTQADYIIFVIGQHWGKYCAPNSAYEKLLGVENGVWTSKRDLIMEIAQGLAARVKLILYMTARAPMRHYKVIQAMQDTLPSIRRKTSRTESRSDVASTQSQRIPTQRESTPQPAIPQELGGCLRRMVETVWETGFRLVVRRVQD